MLKNTFCHIRGISLNQEKKFWENNILTWSDFISLEEKDLKEFLNLSISTKKFDIIKKELKFSLEELEKSNLSYFTDKIPSKEIYRLYGYGKIAFVDIETTGLSKWVDDITMIGIYDGNNFLHSYIKGIDLEKAYEKLEEFDIIVTFNGKCFDMPFIEFKSNKKYDLVHLDLRYLLKEFGLSGGLKNIEKTLGIKRSDETVDIDGFEAVRLWRRYLKGDSRALELLKEYNREDIVNLKYLIEWYLTKKKEVLGLN